MSNEHKQRLNKIGFVWQPRKFKKLSSQLLVTPIVPHTGLIWGFSGS